MPAPEHRFIAPATRLSVFSNSELRPAYNDTRRLSQFKLKQVLASGLC